MCRACMHEEAGGQLAVVNRSSSTTFVTRPSYSRGKCPYSPNLLTTLQFGFEFWTKKKKKKRFRDLLLGVQLALVSWKGLLSLGQNFPA